MNTSLWIGNSDLTIVQANVTAIKAVTDLLPDGGALTTLTNDQNVPTADSAANTLIRDAVGNKTDTVAGNSLIALNKKEIANIGDASGDTLKSVNAKLGNDAFTVKARLDVVDVSLTVPPADSALNGTIGEVIGNKTDTVAGSSIVALEKIGNAAINTANANIGNPATNNLTSLTAKLGNDTVTVKARFDLIDSNITVPAPDSATNTEMRDVIGNKTDTIAGTSIATKALRIDDHVHSIARVYPTLANGVVVTGAAGAWAEGAYVVIVPTNTIQSPFDIHYINVAAFNANDTFELSLYAGPNGGEIEVGRVRFTRLSNVGAAPHIPFQTPIIAANSQIKAKIASQAGTSNTATISIMYHTY
jgi:hypothetical protein